MYSKKMFLRCLAIVFTLVLAGFVFNSTLTGCSGGEGDESAGATPGSGAATPGGSSGNGVSMTKTSVTSPEGGSVTLTFTFASPLTNNATPTVTVNSSAVARVTVGTPSCQLNDGKTQYVCTLTGIDSCKSIIDYVVSLSGTGVPSFTTTFSSADDEFESEATFGSSGAPSSNKCWMGPVTAGIPGDGVSATYHKTLGAGTLKLFIDDPGSDRGSLAYYKIFPPSQNFSAATLIKQRTQPSETGDVLAALVIDSILDDYSRTVTSALFVGQMNTIDGWWMGHPRYEMVKPIGTMAATSENTPLYFCFSKYNNNIKAYVSLDGKTYVPLTTENMQCEQCGTKTVSDIINKTVSGDNSFAVSLGVESYTGANGPFSADFDYIRFRSIGVTGTASDCPPL